MSKGKMRVIYTTIICVGLILLILWLFLRMSVGTEEFVDQKEISVILYYAGKDGWESLQEGMKQAEDDFSVNINYVIMREDADGEEQVSTIEKEIENGAEGILIAVCDAEKLSVAVEEKKFKVPIVAIESGFAQDSYPVITADNYEMGKYLGEEILKDFPNKEGLTVVLGQEGNDRDCVEQRRQGLEDALAGKAQIISTGELIGLAKPDVAVGLCKESVLQLLNMRDRMLKDVKLYGIGNTASVVAALDQGKIEKLVFQNEFNMGYLGVERLLSDINNVKYAKKGKIDYYCVTRQELYGTQYEQLLFPIVE